MTDRGTKLERAEESLRRTREALARNVGAPSEVDWREALERSEARVAREIENAIAADKAAAPFFSGDVYRSDYRTGARA